MSILHYVKGQLSPDCYEMASLLMSDSDVRMVADGPVEVDVKSILPTIQVQEKIAEKSSRNIYGVVELIAKLTELNGDDTILRYGFISSCFAGDFYFLKNQDFFIGARIIKR